MQVKADCATAPAVFFPGGFELYLREELDNLQNQTFKMANEPEYSGRRVEHIWTTNIMRYRRQLRVDQSTFR